MEIFNDFDVYGNQYSYDEMKVMNVLARKSEAEGLDFEDLMCIIKAVFTVWANNESIAEDDTLKIKGREEEGYIQAYAWRTLPKFIELYKNN